MKKNLSAALALVALSLCHAAAARAQSAPDDPPRYEVGIHFSTLTLTPSSDYRSEIGFGGRLTLNLNRHVALEAETTLFPNSSQSGAQRARGNAAQALFGVKAGKRWEKFGVFAKVRPGLISFSDGHPVYDVSTPGVINFRAERATHFATDAGGVLELYVSRRIMTRFDVGDTIIRYGSQTIANPFPPPLNFSIRQETLHNLQVNGGIGFRF